MQWILSNEKRPDNEGIYYCKDSVGVKSMVDFYNGMWHSLTGHPTEFWLDESPSPKEKELREALEYIANPIKYLQKQADKEGAKLNGQMAVEFSNDANFLKSIATEALKQ